MGHCRTCLLLDCLTESHMLCFCPIYIVLFGRQSVIIQLLIGCKYRHVLRANILGREPFRRVDLLAPNHFGARTSPRNLGARRALRPERPEGPRVPTHSVSGHIVRVSNGSLSPGCIARARSQGARQPGRLIFVSALRRSAVCVAQLYIVL